MGTHPIFESDFDCLTEIEIGLKHTFGMSTLVMVIGPTGVGKTKLGIEIAKRFDGEIISMDSMQVYKSLDILSNKVTAEEAQGIKHHLISEIEIQEQFDANQFVEKTDSLIKSIRKRKKLPVIVGGTCYYAYNLFVRKCSRSGKISEQRLLQIEKWEDEFEKLKMAQIRNSDNNGELKKIEEELGLLLEKIDSHAYKITRHNPKKYQTFLHSFFKYKTSIKDLNRSHVGHYNSAMIIWISSDFPILFKRIDDRSEEMVTKGLKEEIRDFIRTNKNYNFTRSQFAAIGLKQLLPIISNENNEEIYHRCIHDLKRVTKKYASSQEKYIKSKFCESDRFPGLPPIFKLDATVIDNWNMNVKEPALQNIKNYLDFGLNSVRLPTAHETSLFSEAEDYFENQNDKNITVECLSCDVKVIKSQYQFHIKSRRHKKRLEGIR